MSSFSRSASGGRILGLKGNYSQIVGNEKCIFKSPYLIKPQKSSSHVLPQWVDAERQAHAKTDRMTVSYKFHPPPPSLTSLRIQFPLVDFV